MALGLVIQCEPSRIAAQQMPTTYTLSPSQSTFLQVKVSAVKTAIANVQAAQYALNAAKKSLTPLVTDLNASITQIEEQNGWPHDLKPKIDPKTSELSFEPRKNAAQPTPLPSNVAPNK